MLRAALLFFIIGWVAYAFGVYGVAGLSIELGRILLAAFLFIAVVSVLFSLISGGRGSLPRL